MSKKSKLIEWMRSKQACEEASNWVGKKTSEQAWAECERSDWMLWALGRTSLDPKVLVKLACDFALSVVHLNTDPRVSTAIALADRWASGDEAVTARQLDEACAAAFAVYAAYVTADAANAAARAAAYAANAATYAAVDADAATYAAAVRAAHAADAAADAATYASADTAAARAARVAYAADAAYAANRDMTELIRARVSPAEFAALVSGGQP